MSDSKIQALKEAQTDTAAAFLAGAHSTLRVETIEGVPYLLDPVSAMSRSLEDLLPAPKRQKTTRTLYSLEDFIEYLRRFKLGETSVYVLPEGNSYVITAEIDHRGPESTAWHDHKVRFALQFSEPFTRWRESNKRRLDQEAFADLLEERARDIVDPVAAEILEIAQSLHVTRNLSVKSVVRANGQNQLEFNRDEKLKGKDGSVDLPTRFRIAVEPFARHREKCTIDAFLRPRIADDRPQFVYELQLVDEAVEEVLNQIVSAIKTQTDLPVYR